MSKLRIFIVKSIIYTYLLLLLLPTVLIFKSLAVVYNLYNIYNLYNTKPLNFFYKLKVPFYSSPFFLFFWIFLIVVGNIPLIILMFILLIIIWKISYLNINKVINPGLAVKRDDLPALYNILDELKLATGLKIPIYIYIKYSGYAYSYIIRDKNIYNITLSSQLLMSLNRNEVQAVISYELAHLIDNNLEILEYISRLIYICSYSRFSFIFSPLILIIKPLIKDLVYINDATAIHITKNPDSLKSALKSIKEINNEAPNYDFTSPDYYIDIANISITNPYESRKNDLVHPPTSHRIFIIDKIKGSSYSLDVYSQAYKNVTGKSIKKALTKLPVITYSPAIYNDNTRLLTEQSGFYVTIIRSIRGYISYSCKCGLKMNLPAEYYKQYCQCPRCKAKVIFHEITLKDIKFEKERNIEL